MTSMRRGLMTLLGFALIMPAAHAQPAFSVDSPTLQPQGTMPQAQIQSNYGCSGANRSPQLAWHNAPPGTRSYAVTIFDLDAPGHGWWHWAVSNLPPNLDGLPENASASGLIDKLGGVESRNDFGDDGYGGPCPPPGKLHHYLITVYALNGTDTRLATGRPALMFDHEIRITALASASLTVTYQR
jgi:Raf kinase inhibitor-like YbhB/YbcL family protein